MKRATREWAKSQIELQREMRTHGDRYFVDILDSDKKQRAKERRLIKALRIAAPYIPVGPNWRRFSKLTSGINLSNKKWRAGK